jgi:hypothetical protein
LFGLTAPGGSSGKVTAELKLVSSLGVLCTLIGAQPIRVDIHYNTLKRDIFHIKGKKQGINSASTEYV